MFLEFTSVDLLLDFAMNEEQFAIDLYKRLARLSHNFEKKKMYEQLLLQEMKHKHYLATLRYDMVDEFTIENIEEIKIEKHEGPALLFVDNKQDYLQALRMAIQLEERTILLYKQLTSHIHNSSINKVLETFVKEEENHRIEFEFELSQTLKGIPAPEPEPLFETDLEEPFHNIYFTRFYTSLNRFCRYSISFLLALIGIRLYEAFIIPLFFGFPKSSWKTELIGLPYDLSFFLGICGVLVIPFFLLNLVKPRVAALFYHISVCLLIVISLGLIGYFAQTLVPLGSDIFAYSLKEINETIGASGSLKLTSFLPFLLFIGIYVVSATFLRKKILSNKVSWTFMIVSFISLFLFLKVTPQSTSFKKEFDFYLANNKTTFFINKTIDYLEKQHAVSMAQLTKEEQNKDNKNFSYTTIDMNYPFLHLDNQPDVLGSFFNLNKSTPPNIVFIFVESLGRAYSGKNAYLGSFTPYLDSLEDKSLFWDNFTSSAGRTFAVLPSCLGSLPFGDKGFLEMDTKMPDHFSLISLLKQNNYTTSFYYGGEAQFDLMEGFLKKNGIDKIYDENNFGANYEKLPAKGNGFSWGYGDKEIFRKHLAESQSTKKPRLDMMLTIAMHDPFKVQNQEQYLARFENRLNTLKIEDEKKNDYRSYKYMYATMIYFDDALRSLIAGYQKRADFNNTIFIITGDHRMPEIPIATQIDRFHVPLVIYSPMLKRSKAIHSMSSHFDITPSLIAMLRNKYNLKLPSVSTWLGTGLDTVEEFRSIHSTPLMRNKNEMLDYIDGEYYLANNVLYKIDKHLGIEPLDDEKLLFKLQQKFKNFKIKNSYATSKNLLLPDSLKKK